MEPSVDIYSMVYALLTKLCANMLDSAMQYFDAKAPTGMYVGLSGSWHGRSTMLHLASAQQTVVSFFHFYC